jgi:ADP-heptose:LPS heptosyltransferase
LFKSIPLIKLIVYFFVNLLVRSSNKINKKNLLIIRLDAIGDYVLFRNFIKILKTNNNYKDYKLTLLGNIRWKSLAIDLDSEFIEHFIWLDRDRFSRDLSYRYFKLKEITSKGYEEVLSPSYSREFYCIDNIVKIVSAKNKIGSVGDYSNISKWQKIIGDRYYTKLIDANNEIVFEFLRNKIFFENFLGSEIELTKPTIQLNDRNVNINLPKHYVILFVGAGEKFRQYNIKNFVEIAKHLNENYNYEIVLCGGNDDIQIAKEFGSFFEGHYLDLVAKTSLSDLLQVINLGDLIISNDSSAPHIAVALGKINVIVISNGNHYGRFTPYPESITDRYSAIYHPFIEKKKHKYKELINSYGYSSNLNIDDIDVRSVLKKIDNVL